METLAMNTSCGWRGGEGAFRGQGKSSHRKRCSTVRPCGNEGQGRGRPQEGHRGQPCDTPWGGSKQPQIVLTNLSLPGVPLLEISAPIKNINKGSPSRAGFKRNPARRITHRRGVWKTSHCDSYRMMHSFVKITPLRLPLSPFHLLFLCPL